jgi:hypothetical protein
MNVGMKSATGVIAISALLGLMGCKDEPSTGSDAEQTVRLCFDGGVSACLALNPADTACLAGRCLSGSGPNCTPGECGDGTCTRVAEVCEGCEYETTCLSTSICEYINSLVDGSAGDCKPDGPHATLPDADRARGDAAVADGSGGTD